MAEIDAGLLAKIEATDATSGYSTLTGFLRGRKKYIGTLIEATGQQTLNELQQAIKRRGGRKLKVYPEIHTIYAEMPVNQVTELATVSAAQKIYDAAGDIQLSLHESVPLIMGAEKWQLPYRVRGRKLEGQGVKIAVIDSGIDARHPDLAGRVKKRKNFSGGRRRRGTEHGTHVAGIIAGSGRLSGYRHTGVAPKATLFDVKVFINSRKPTTRHAIIAATLWAVKKKADIINMSFGDNQGCKDGTCLLCKTVNYAVSQGVTVVSAAGNVGPAQGTISCPGNASEAVTVGATTKTTPPVVAGFSSRGSPQHPGKPDVVAPGEKIVAPQPNRSYTAMSGTSMATPHVTGIAALLFQSSGYVNGRKHKAPAELKRLIKQGVTDLGEHTTAQGSGLVNFKHELDTLQQSRKPALWFRKKKLQGQPSADPTLAEANEQPPTSCPARMQMFCPHHQQELCQTAYETCVHYQITQHFTLLKTLRMPDGQQPQTVPDTAVFQPDETLPTYRGTTSFSGKIIGTMSRKPIADLRIAMQNSSAYSNRRGKFNVHGIPKGITSIVISGPAIQPRTVYVHTAKKHSIKIDAIQNDRQFNLRFYRELARGNHPMERQLNPIYRWTAKVPPVFYINTNASAVHGGEVSKQAIKTARSVIMEILPVFSGRQYWVTPIKVCYFDGMTFDQIPHHSVVITFNDHILSQHLMGITFTAPDFTSWFPGSLDKVMIFVAHRSLAYHSTRYTMRQVIAHEVGHGFGYRHTSCLPSIMGKSILYEGGLFSPADKFHMHIMYHRPVGNTDIDNDPFPGRKMGEHTPKTQVFVDVVEDIQLPANLKKELERLPDAVTPLLQDAERMD